MTTEISNTPAVPVLAAPLSLKAATLVWRTENVALKLIRPNPDQPRDHITPESVAAMADSLAANGLLEPILLWPVPGGHALGAGTFMIIAGERRYQGAKKLKWEEIDARVAPPGCTLALAQMFALIENLHREDLNAMQVSRGYAQLVKLGLTHEQIGKQVGVEKSTVTNALRLLELPESVQKLIGAGELTAKHGISILRFKAYPRVMDHIAKCAARDEESAERLREGLPYYWEMEQAKIVVPIASQDLAAANVTQSELKAQPWFFGLHHYFYSLDPQASGSWLAEKKAAYEKQQQEKAAAELAKYKAAVEKAKAAGKPPPKKPEPKKPAEAASAGGNGRRGGGMSEAEKRQRKQKIEENRTNRANLQLMFEQAVETLNKADKITSAMAAVVVGWAMDKIHYSHSDDKNVRQAAARLGLTWKGWKAADKMAPVDLIRLVLMVGLEEQLDFGTKNAWEDLDDLQVLAVGWEKRRKPAAAEVAQKATKGTKPAKTKGAAPAVAKAKAGSKEKAAAR